MTDTGAALATRPMRRGDLSAVAALLADQYRRWHASDPRLSCPPQVERAARRVLEYDRDLAETWAVVAEQGGQLAGYMRAWWRHFDATDAQLMWLPQDHLTCEIFFQFAAAASADPGAVFAALFAAMSQTTPAPPTEPWVLSLVPPGAGLDRTLAGLGFRATSIFAYRPGTLPVPQLAPPPGYTIRPATQADFPTITQLYADLCTYHAHNDPFADREPPRLWDDFGYVLRTVLADSRRWVLLVAEAPGAAGPPLAFSLASVDTEAGGPALISQLPPGRVGFIHDFMIAEEARGHGLGRALWSATCTALNARAPGDPARGGLHGTWLIYRPTNPTGSRFWPTLGYTPLYLMWRRGGWL